MTLKELQTAVKKSKLNAYIVTRSNMFIGQDLLDDENPLRALTGFSGGNLGRHARQGLSAG